MFHLFLGLFYCESASLKTVFTWQGSSDRESLFLSICTNGCPICTAVLGFFQIIPLELNHVTHFKIELSWFDGLLEGPQFCHGEQFPYLRHPKQNIYCYCSIYKGFFIVSWAVLLDTFRICFLPAFIFA